MYFPLRTEPLDAAEARLRGLRLSLNGPVVQAESLPVGPARAAIVVHDEPDGRPNVTLAVRSLRSGEVVLYSYEGDLREPSSRAVGIDAALSFGESMGFLFDDDELEGDAGARALAYERLVQWLEGPVASLPGPRRTPSPPPPAAAPSAAEDEAEELLLEETLEPVSEPALPPAAPRGPEPGPPVRPTPEAGSRPRATAEAKPVLSKFRGRGATASPGEGTSPKAPPRPRRESGAGAAPLGRVRLVKRRADGTAPPEDRPSFLFRLLALF